MSELKSQIENTVQCLTSKPPIPSKNVIQSWNECHDNSFVDFVGLEGYSNERSYSANKLIFEEKIFLDQGNISIETMQKLGYFVLELDLKVFAWIVMLEDKTNKHYHLELYFSCKMWFNLQEEITYFWLYFFVNADQFL